MKTLWEVQGKHGKGWTNLGVYYSVTDLNACQQARVNHKYKLMRVKSAEIPDKWHRYRFIPLTSHVL